MKLLQHFLSWLLVLQLSGVPVLLAQPVLIQPGNPFGNQQPLGSGIENLRVAQTGRDGTEAELTMDYTYDGFSGPVARILPMIGKKGQKGVSAWFGSDPVTVGRGRGTITLRVRYFNDEPGVPAMFTSDQVRILILNPSGTALLSTVPFLKTINWGNATARQDQKAPPPLALIDKATAERIAKEKREAEAKANQEAAAREKARLQAEAEVKLRKEAEEKARVEALVREEAREEQRKLAEAQERTRLEAEAKALAEAKAKALAEARAAADANAAAEAKAQAEAKALAEAKARQQAKDRADAEAKRREEERKLADAKRVAEDKARDEARLRAEAEEKRLAGEKRAADEKVLAEGRARKAAEDKAWQEALAQAKAELSAKKLSEEKAQAEAVAQAASGSSKIESLAIALDKKTKVTNVDVVNRSMDRTQMTFGVEFEYKDQLSEPMLGVDVLRETEPEASRYFVSQVSEIGKSRRNFALFPVKFAPPSNLPQNDDFMTDKVLIYLTDKRAQRYNIFPATMLLHWRGANAPRSAPQFSNSDRVEIDDFKQNDPSNGSISAKYNLVAGKGRLRAKVYDAAAPSSAAYFTSNTPEVGTGPGLELIDVRIDSDAKTPSDLVRADTIEVELVDSAGRVLAKSSRKAAMVWTRPK